MSWWEEGQTQMSGWGGTQKWKQEPYGVLGKTGEWVQQSMEQRQKRREDNAGRPCVG